MTLTDRLNEALKDHLTGLGVSGVSSSINDTPNAEETSRVICRATSSQQLAPNLPGIYKVNGEVILRYSADADSAQEGFRADCQELKSFLGNRQIIEAGLPSQDGALRIYNNSWHLDGQSESAGERGFQAIFSWRVTATDTISTN